MTDPLCAAIALDRECGASLAKLAQWYSLPASEIKRLLYVANVRYPLCPLTRSVDSNVASGEAASAAARPPSSVSSHTVNRGPGL